MRSSGTSTAQSRTGFTLLEVIIALSMTLLLLTAVYGAIQLQYRLSTAGREEMERAQVARAVLRKIETDIRAVVWQVQEPGSTSSDSESSSTGTGGGTGEAVQEDVPADEPPEILTTDDAFTSGSSGVFGDSQNLVLHISRPSRDLVYAASEEAAAEASGRSDQASVSYFMADATAGGLSAAVAQQNGGGSSVLGGVAGLARLEGDRLTIEQAGAEGGGGDDFLASSAQVLAPEVVSIEFAYWDGLEWLDSWDSVSSGTLPSAIGITLEIDTTTEAADRTRAALIQQSVQTGEPAETSIPVRVQYVVALPLAEPYVGETSF